MPIIFLLKTTNYFSYVECELNQVGLLESQSMVLFCGSSLLFLFSSNLFSLFLSSLFLFVWHSHLLQLEGRCFWPQLDIILAQIVLGPPCLSYDLDWGSHIYHLLFLKLPIPLINPLWSDLEIIKGNASKHFMEIMTHSLAICLTSTPSWHWEPLYKS